jgi:hypothetical protein
MMHFPIYEETKLFQAQIVNISLLGTINHHRYRWNPFSEENEMTRSSEATKWIKWLKLSKRGGRHQDGVYSFRFVVNHNPQRLLKLENWISDKNFDADNNRHLCLSGWLNSSTLGKGLRNCTVHVQEDCEACIVIDQEKMRLEILCDKPRAITPINHVSSVQINGFVWDSLDMFQKFNERMPGREMQRVSEYVWEKKVSLQTTGGIDFRADGVYQFLISVNGDEDQGFGGLNHQNSDTRVLDLVPGTGFGSSHGTSYHSAPTVKISKDEIYTITALLEPGNERLMIKGSSGETAEVINNKANGMQLLGDIFPSDSFDPTQSQSQMTSLDASGQLFERVVDLEPGTYSINFAIGGELFLDTMGLGCWMKTNGTVLRGVGWHGKPNESNIGFRVLRKGIYSFTYNRSNDIFSIEARGPVANHPACLEAVCAISTLSIVGNMPSPLIAWDPTASENLMSSLGRGRFERMIDLSQGTDYEFKLVGNQSNWQIVFADYELDGYGLSYATNNPNPYNSSLEDLRTHGHLTTHGNPPPIHFVPSVSGPHLVMVDLWSGAYGIKAV